MKIQKKLNKLGIIKKRELNYKEVNYIAHYVADKITITFLILQTQYNEILAKVLNCKMYYAKISTNISKVNYIYEDDSIYIDESIDILKPNEQLFHEIIHYLQVVRKNNSKIKKMGLCKFGDFSINGLGLNEAIVQYMSSKIMDNEKENIKVCNIRLKTISPKSYPLLTNLMEQLIYYLGEKEIIESAMNVNNNFEDKFLNTFEEKKSQIVKNFDKLLEINNKIAIELNEKLKTKFEEKACEIYKSTEELMLTKYYDQIVSRLITEKEIDAYTEKLVKNREYLGIEDLNNENFYERYKIIATEKLDRQLMKINKAKQKNALTIYNNKIKEFLKKTISYLWN